MASISSLPKAFKDIKLRLINVDSPNEIGVYSLHEAQWLPLSLLGPGPDPVKESATYRMELIAFSPIDGFEIEIRVNGSDPISAHLSSWQMADKEDEEKRLLYYTNITPEESSDSRPLFFLTYGFARVEITFFSDEEEYCFSTRDIVSIGSEPYQNDLIEQMLNDLLNSSRTKVLDWMLTGEEGSAKR